MMQYYKDQGMWDPPESNFRVHNVIKSFFHLNRKRKFFVPAMGGQVIHHHIDETELKSFLELNPSGLDLDWFLKIFYEIDDYYVNKYLNKPEPKKGR